MPKTSEAERIKSRLRPTAKKQPQPLKLSTGCWVLNLACSGNTKWGLLSGHFYVFVGDSRAGKSVILKQIMTEACINEDFKNHAIIDDNPEKGMLMDLSRFFPPLVARMRPPSYGTSRTLEEFYDNVDDAAKEGPFIYGLDSEDALESEDSIKKAKENKAIRRKSNAQVNAGDDPLKTKGSYGDGKAKKNSSGLRTANNLLGDKSILMMIKQTRDNIGPTAMFNPKTRSGGRSLTFYATLELWFSIVGSIKKKVCGKTLSVGKVFKIDLKKNRETGKDRSVEVVYFPDHGIHNLWTSVRWLIDWGHWKGSIHEKYTVDAPEFDFEGKISDLVCKIEDEGTEDRLRQIVAEKWADIEDQCATKFKPKYAPIGQEKG